VLFVLPFNFVQLFTPAGPADAEMASSNRGEISDRPPFWFSPYLHLYFLQRAKQNSSWPGSFRYLLESTIPPRQFFSPFFHTPLLFLLVLTL